MGCFKLDKLDKIVIAFTFIIVTMSCIFNTFCFASETLIAQTKSNATVNNNYIITESDTQTLYFFNLEKGHKYKLSNNYDYNYSLYLGDSTEYGTQLEIKYYKGNLGPGESVEFIAEDNYMLGFYTSVNISEFFQLEDITGPGLTNAISDLVGTFGFGFFDNILVGLMPFISIVVLFSLGVWFIKHNIIEHSKGREY